MWELDVTRDGRATTGRDDVGVKANKAVVASTRRRSAFSATWTQSMVSSAPIELDGLEIVVYFCDRALCKNELVGKAPK